jgi:hypothetical protein
MLSFRRATSGLGRNAVAPDDTRHKRGTTPVDITMVTGVTQNSHSFDNFKLIQSNQADAATRDANPGAA